MASELERVEAAVDGLVAATRTASWTLARAVVENYLLAPGSGYVLLGTRVLELMREAEEEHSRG